MIFISLTVNLWRENFVSNFVLQIFCFFKNISRPLEWLKIFQEVKFDLLFDIILINYRLVKIGNFSFF